MLLYFLGKLLSGHLWRKSVLISILIRSLVPFILSMGITSLGLLLLLSELPHFSRQKLLSTERSKISVVQPVSFVDTPGTVIRKINVPLLILTLPLDLFLIESYFWVFFFF